MDFIKNMIRLKIKYGWMTKDIRFKLIKMVILLNMIRLVILLMINKMRNNSIIISKDGKWKRIQVIT